MNSMSYEEQNEKLGGTIALLKYQTTRFPFDNNNPICYPLWFTTMLKAMSGAGVQLWCATTLCSSWEVVASHPTAWAPRSLLILNLCTVFLINSFQS